MSERFKASVNLNGSKNTRLPIALEFGNYRFGRDALAHVSRYLYIVENLIVQAKARGAPLRVLDIGCGDIYIARTFQASFRVTKSEIIFEYVGFDIDDKSLARTGASLPHSFPIRLVQGDVTTGGLAQFQDKDFDVIICTEVIEHVLPEFVRPLLAEIQRIAHMAYISTPNWDGGSGRLPEDHIKEWTYPELDALMVDLGYEVTEVIGTFCNLPKAKKIMLADPQLAPIWHVLNRTMDKHFLSLACARLIGSAAQNVLQVCHFD